MPDIYCDMDGVLVDLLHGYRIVTGECLTNLRGAGDEKWDAAIDAPNFWQNLPMARDASHLMVYLAATTPPEKLFILSAPQHCFPTCVADKKSWIEDNTTIFCPTRVNIVKRKLKAEFAMRPDGTPNILIDDYQKNIDEWVDAGGIGVIHTDTQSTIAQINDYRLVKNARVSLPTR